MIRCMMCGKIYNTLYRINDIWYCYGHLPKKEVENRRIFFKGSSLDMSLAGIDVMLATKYSEQLDPQMKVNLEIVLPSPWGLIRAEGQVNQMKPAHVRRKPTLVSIEFVSMEEKETKKLKEFLYGDTNEVH